MQRQNSRQSTRASVRLWTVAPIVGVVLCFCAVCAFVLIEARRALWTRAGDTGASLVAAIESDIVRNIEALSLSLQGVVKNLKRPDIDRLSPELRQLVLFDHSATARPYGAILVLDANGRLRFNSQQAEPKPLDLSDRDYFRIHRESRPAALYVGHPQAAGNSGAIFVGISLRIANLDGSFGGVVAATIQLDYFKKLFKDIALGEGGNITLARTDGTILMRWPFDASILGRNVDNAEFLNRIARNPSGRYEASSDTDGVRRLVVYSRIGDLPIVIGVGQAVDDIFAEWRRYAWTIGLLVAALFVLSAMYLIHLLGDLKRRDAMEHELATMAATDGLTGVSNRRQFDEEIRREWQRARREQSPLALLMIDADRFKIYNDTHGHQAGDRLLKTIGSAIADSIRRSTDLGARYGGDEFAVILPSTSTEGAARVADQIRDEFVARCRADGIGQDARISIGIASLVPDQAAAPTALLEAADEALYRAKGLGRNRTECAEAAAAAPAEPVDAPQTRAA